MSGSTAFPVPGPRVLNLFDDLHLAVLRPPETREELQRIADLPRPWDPATCPDEIAQEIWQWLARVAQWINREHCWRIERLLPECWLQHPHIAHQVATVAALRLQARYAHTPDPLEDWHRLTLPSFLHRVAEELGPTGCPPGRHSPHPGTLRLNRAASEAERLGPRASMDPC